MRIAVFLAFLLASSTAAAQDLATACHASSSYDLTVRPRGIVFDRPQPAPRQVVLDDGSVAVDGHAVALRPDLQDQAALFERQVRALLPRLRSVADAGVDGAARAVRDEVARSAPSALQDGEFDQKLSGHVAELHTRITHSNSTHDWQGDAFESYANNMVGDLAPLVAASLTSDAVDLAMNGDLAGAAALRDRAGSLAGGLQARVQARVNRELRPQVQALCPDIRRLAELSQGLTDERGRRLDLLQVTP
jgi:DUF2884 family protein